MALAPVVRYMILCDDWSPEPAGLSRPTVVGLLSFVESVADPPYPIVFEQLVVLLVLTECRGPGRARVVCVSEDTGQKAFESPTLVVPPALDPLATVVMPVRLLSCRIYQPGTYLVQFWYDGVLLREQPLHMR